MPHRIIQVVNFDPIWAQLFEAEFQLLSETLGANALAIEHIGSTSVPKLAAKPIIDILVAVECLDAIDEKNEQMQAAGYTVKGEYGIAGRRYFQKGGFQRTHHVHVFRIGDSNLTRHRAFKAYLIAHPDIANEYAKLKLDAARKSQNSSQLYMALKNDFIHKHEILALTWLKQSG